MAGTADLLKKIGGGSAPASKPTTSGAKGGTAALASLAQQRAQQQAAPAPAPTKSSLPSLTYQPKSLDDYIRGSFTPSTPAPAPKQEEKKPWYSRAASKVVTTLQNTKPIQYLADGFAKTEQFQQDSGTKSLGAHAASLLFDNVSTFTKKIAEPLSNTKLFREAAEGYNAMEAGEVEPDAFSYLGITLPEQVLEASKAFGRGSANVVDTIIAAPANFATRSIYGKSNPIGDFFHGFANEMNEKLTTEQSRKLAEESFGLKKVTNPAFWINAIGENLPVTMAFMGVGTKVAGATGGLASRVSALMGNSAFGKVAAGAIEFGAGAAAMRAFEGSAEAEEAYYSAKAKGMSEEEALKAGRSTFVNNLWLIGVDAVQLAMAMSPQAKGTLAKIIKETAMLGAGAVSEGGEEIYQYHVQQNAIGDRMSFGQRLKDPKALEAGVIGAAMGLMFEAGGRINEFHDAARERYMDEVAERLPAPAQAQYNNANTAEDKEAILDRIAEQDPNSVTEAVQDLEADYQRSAEATRQVFDTIDNIPTPQEVAQRLATGATPAQVTLELGSQIGVEEARTLVEAAQSIAPVAPQTDAVAETNAKLTEITNSTLQKTPADLQAEFTALDEQLDTKLSEINQSIGDLRQQIEQATNNSPEKKALKKQLSELQAQRDTTEREFQENITGQAQELRDFLADYIPAQSKVELTVDELNTIIDNIVDQITEPDAVRKSFNVPISEIVARQIQSMGKEVERSGRQLDPELEVPAAVEPQANEDWQNNYAEKYNGLAAKAAELKEKIKTAKGAVKTRYENQLKKIEAQMREIEKEFVKKWKDKAEGKEVKTPIEDQADKARELAEKQQKERQEKEAEKGKNKPEKEDKKPLAKSTIQEEYLTDIAKKDLYHGTLAAFDRFDINRAGSNTEWENASWGFFFIDDQARAEQFIEDTRGQNDGEGRIIRAKVDIKNPLDLTLKGITTKEDQASVIYEAMSGEKLPNAEALQQLDDAIDLGTVNEFFEELYSNKENRKLFIEAGYDGLVAEFGRTENSVIHEYVAFEPDQIVILDKNIKNKDNNANEDTNDSGSTDNTGRVSEPVSDSPEKSDGAGSTASQSGQSERGGKRPASDSDSAGERLGSRLTNEQILERLSQVTTINKSKEDAGKNLVMITKQITEPYLEAANQYKTGGTSKEGRGILDEYYTDKGIVDVVKSMLDFPIDTKLKVLEPAVGTGNFLYALPDVAAHDVTGFEINETTARIAKIFHQSANIYNRSFETMFIDERGNKKEVARDYDLVIGNPPYGEHRGKYMGLGELSEFKKYEEYFIARGLSVLKDTGRLVMVVPSGFIRGGESNTKIGIANVGILEAAYRFPNGAFEGTDIGTDLVIFRRRDGKNDLTDLSSFVNDNYFKENPQNILGTQKKRKGKFGMEDYVEGDLESAINLFYENHNETAAIKILQDLKLPETNENVETAEEAIEETGEQEAAKALVKQAQKQGKKTIAQKVKKTSAKTGETVSLINQFPDFTDAEIEAWQDTQADGSLNNPEKHKDLANFMGGKWYLDFNYLQGDIYAKLTQLEIDKKNMEPQQYESQKRKLESVKPTPESIDNLRISPNIGFAKDLKLEQTAEDEEAITLRSEFLKWLDSLPYQAFGQSSKWEVHNYVNNEPVRGNDKDLNEKIRVRRKQMADSLFDKFLKEGLTDEQKKLVEDTYNETFNFYHTPDYKKVPMFSSIHATFNGKPLKVRDVQKHGIGRLVSTGVGILAHDVGFGKTMSGVLAVSETMHRGWAKKPLIVAPNENVYRQWVSTIEELIPNAKLNLLGNLGTSYKGDLSSLKIEDGTISLVTYEGLKRLGFNDDTYDRMGQKFEYIADDLAKHKTEREHQKSVAKEEASAGRMKKGTRADLSFEDLGFDHLTFDEVHNANHIVSKVKLPKGQASEFNRFTLRPSDLGIKTWLAAQYIQEQNNGRNVNLLSATPFTNHPLEYYSILSLVADKSLTKMGLNNVNDFFGTFMEAENEYEFKADGTYQKKTDIRRFRNYRQFRKLLDTYIDFKEGDAEGIVRPNRIQQTYEIPQNDMGLEMEAQAQEIFKENEKEKGQGAKVLRAITELRKIAFSPYASKFAPDIAPSQYKEFVENSPKIKTLMELMRQNKKDNPEAGQIVYVDQVGVQFLPLMRDYMIKELGYKPAQVEIISGATGKEKRVTIQDNYNKGDIKVILGSEAIKEGMNLQQNTTDLYILSLPWNFTQLRQVIGRAWRQGNEWANVRINNLFIQDSVDIFLSQKLENKQKRYEAAINSGENEVDVGDVSFDQLKFDLIRDPQTRASLELQAEKERLSQEIAQEKAELAFATRKADKINDIAEEIERTKDYIKNEEKRNEEALAKGEEASDYWINRYTEDLKKLNKQYKEETDKLAERGVDVATLERIRTERQAKIDELVKEQEALEKNFDQRVSEIAASLPERKPFSDEVVSSFTNDRLEQNKDFFVKQQTPVEETIKAETTVKEIKNAAGTKTVKTKKTTTAKRTKTQSKTDKPATKNTEVFKVLTDSSLSTNEKVDKLLDVKQQSKDFKDVGERVAGSKKERAAIRAVMEMGGGDVFTEMVNRLGIEAVLEVLDKNEILEDTPKPNPEADKKAGVPALIAFTKKDIYDKIQRKFSFRQGRGRYQDYVAWTQEENSSGWSSLDSRDPELASEVIKEYPALLQEFVTKLSAVKTAKEMADFWGWFKQKYNGRQEISTLYGTKIAVTDDIFGKPVADYRAFVPRVVGQSDGSVYSYMSRAYAGSFDINITTPAEQAEWEKALNDEKWWEKAIKKGGKREEGVDLKHGNFKPLERVERSAEPIPDEQVTPENLQTDYGFKSVQFGNYMDDATSREHIRHTMGAITDMSELLDIDFAKLISVEDLSMAYGARGGGGANAHYEPSKNIINLTKGRGDGSFFHEFMHFLDMKVGSHSYRGKWSSKKSRYYRSDNLDKAALDLMGVLTGAHSRKIKEFTPREEPHIGENYPVMKWYQEGKTFDEALELSENRYSREYYSESDILQGIADIYRKPVKKEVEVWNEQTNFAKGSENYGGAYWARPEEMLARAGQAYIEDKMLEKGIKNNYLTRTTIAEDGGVSTVYPQGDERRQFAQAFDKLFAELRNKYPRGEAKFKKEGIVAPEYTTTTAGDYLYNLQDRLKIDFDVHFVDSIMQRGLMGKVEAYGAMFDNTIAIAKDLAKSTAEHEVVHLTLANLDKIPVFKRNDITRKAVLQAKAQQMSKDYAGLTELQVEEALAQDFEQYVENKHQPKGIIRKFFALLKTALIRFARAIGATKGDIIRDYFDILDEGQAVDEEMTRLENKGIMEAFIEDGDLDLTTNGEVVSEEMPAALGAVPRIEARETTNRRAVDEFTKAEMVEAIDYIRLKQPYNQRVEENIGYLATKFGIKAKTNGRIANELEKLVEETKTYEIASREVIIPRFKVKNEGDARVRKLKEQYNDLVENQEKLEINSVAWKTDLQAEMMKQEAAATVLDETNQEVKELSRFTKRNKPPVELTERGIVEAENKEFADPEAATAEITEYLKRKTELMEIRNRMRTLRRDIANAKKEGKNNAKALRDIERRLKMRKRLLEQKDFYVSMGMKRGKKEQMKVLSRRRRAIRNAQDFFAIGDKRAKDIINNRFIHLMTEAEFNDFLIEFANKAEKMRTDLDAREELDALIESKQFNKVENLRQAMGLPPRSKMSEAEANQLIEVLSKYRFGDVFLTKRELETVHRTNWGEIKTERELLAKLQEHTGTSVQDLKSLTAPPNDGKFTPWIKLARSHPFYNWLVSKRVEASIKAEREYTAIEDEVNKLTRAARHERHNKMSLLKRAGELLVPTDEVVFGYMEAENKEAYAKEHDMGEKELELARYLISVYHSAYEYMQSEYGMRGRQNYMTHVRRSFVEALKESGIREAFGELFTSQQEDEAAFKILDGETGNTIAFEKFFGFAMRRTGKLQPSKNIARASLSYFQAFAKKKALDEFVPEALIAVQAHKAVIGTTEKGLTKDPTFERFVKTFLNDAKGRKIDFVTKQGTRLDIAARAFMKWISVKYLGLNLASAIANVVGDFTAVFWELSMREMARGAVRSLNIPKAHEVNQQFRYFAGRNPIAEMFDSRYNVPSRLLKAIMVPMAIASFQSNKFFLRAKMTPEEWRTMVVKDERLTEIANSLSRVKPNQFYVNSLAGNTTMGGAAVQFGTWAIAITNTIMSDVGEVKKTWSKKGTWEALSSEESKKLAKFAIMATTLAMLAGLMTPDDDDDSWWAQLMRKSADNLSTLSQALQFATDPSNYFLMWEEIINWAKVMQLFISQEKYKQDGEGYGIGDPKWVNQFKRVITPSVLKQYQSKDKVDTKLNMIQEAIKSGDFNPEKIAETTNPDEWNNVKGERTEKEQEEYRKNKVAELKVQHNFYKKYPNNEVGKIVLEEKDNSARIEKIKQYDRETGRGWGELQELYRDRDLCNDPRKKTGCLISDKLFKDYRKAK